MFKKLLGCCYRSTWRFCESLCLYEECSTTGEKLVEDQVKFSLIFFFNKAAATWVSLPTHCCTMAHYCVGYCTAKDRAKALERIWLECVCEPVGPHSFKSCSCCFLMSAVSCERKPEVIACITCNNKLYPPFIVFFLFLSSGLHIDYVFPAVLEGQAPGLCGNTSQPDTWQQGCWPALGPRHLLSQWQEVFRPWSHSQKPHDPPASRWDCPLWTQVCSACQVFFLMVGLLTGLHVSILRIPCCTLSYDSVTLE